MSRKTVLPDFYQTACSGSREGIRHNNIINTFLHFVLLREFSELDGRNQPVILPEYHNPVARRSMGALPKLDESVYSPLPYGYIDELRQMLASGPNFRDWHWAQNAMGVKVGRLGSLGPEWFAVNEAEIDRNDPDCVWRLRELTNGTSVLEMWSPARWVALLMKLLLPLRTHQVRMLDSGEADTWRYEDGRWILNYGLLAEGTKSRPLQQGVLRRSSVLGGNESAGTILYINTNKTHDISKSGADKGYTVPWTNQGDIHEQAFRWLEKIRNWQEKYNPLSKRTSWLELDGRHIPAKSNMQLASYPDACFLFRIREARSGERHLPFAESALNYPWFRLLEAFNLRLVNRGETHRNGDPIRLLPPIEAQNSNATTLFPLHSLRVSLVTSLVLDGQVPLPIMQKLVGHSRLMMTLYYTKPGMTHIQNALAEAAERIDANKEASIQNFLLDTEHEQLLQLAICNSTPSLAAAIPKHSSARNQVGWMTMHHGVCLVGGNTIEVEGNFTIGGCYNGGPDIGSPSGPKYSSVPGGSRNCQRCRWFVTEPHFIPALVADFNNTAYHFDEARNACFSHEKALQELKKQKADAEDAGKPFANINAFHQTERLWETAMKRFSDLTEDLVACYRLIERCQQAATASQGDGTQLIAVGSLADVSLAIEEIESELLQLTNVCQNVEVYPDLDPGKAVFRRSQILDSALCRDHLRPVFMLLSEQEQLFVGNSFMNRLAQQMDPDNPALGQRKVIQLIDDGVSLSEYLGIDLTVLMPEQAKPFYLTPIKLREIG